MPDALPNLNAMTLDELARMVVQGPSVRTLLELARAEDLGDRGDVTSRSLPGDDLPLRTRITAREPGVACGLVLLPEVMDVFRVSVRVELRRRDGDRVERGDVLAELSGPAREILAVERPILNLLGLLGGTASTTAEYVDAVAGTRAVVCDTRKTVPGYRWLQKYAVRCGGGHLHRMGLDDAALFKDNHLAALPAGPLDETLRPALAAVRAAGPLRFVEVEVDTLDQLDELLRLPEEAVDIVLLDNMPPAVLREAVARRDAAGSDWRLEASGGITLETIRAVAESGVDRISVGALTHSVRCRDFGLDAVGPAGHASGAA